MDDLEFIHKCASGDKSAWNDFFNKYSRLIYSFIHATLKLRGIKQSQDTNVSDIHQGIFVLLMDNNFKKLKTFQARNGCSFAGWLRQVVANHTIDHLRRLKPAISLDEPIADDFSLKDVLVSSEKIPNEHVDYNNKLKELGECIERLDLDEQYFIELHINQKIKLDELKEFFKITRGAIDMRKSRIIDKLKECFKVKGILLDF